jgi:hypothetical protein
MNGHQPINNPVLSHGTDSGDAQAKTHETTATNHNGRLTKRTRQLVEEMNTPNEEHSSPTSRSGMVLSQSNEWFNPLGLH